MQKALLKPILLIAVCICIAGTLFAASPLVKTTHASSTNASGQVAKAATCQTGAFTTTNYAYNEQKLYPGQAWFGITCSIVPVMLGFQTDGNFVLYIGGKAKWSAQTNGKVCVYSSNGTAFVVFQKDGNLVMYDCNHNVVHSTTSNGAPLPSNTSKVGSTLRIQENGNVEIYDTNSVSIWRTDTCCY